jgi:hypothetical protein
MAEATGVPDGRAERRAAAELVGRYHQDQLRLLLDHVRAGFGRLDAGEIDVFDMDDLVFHYKRSAAELWKFCSASGSRAVHAADTIRHLQQQGNEPDWWERGRPRGPKRDRTAEDG